MASSTPALLVSLRLRGQWNGAFEGDLILTNSGSTSLSQWSVSFRSRYALRQLSGFSYSQNQQADGSWLITLTPPRWGCRLAPGASVRSYLQGVLPAATRLGSLSASQVLIGVPGTGSGAGSAPGTGPGAGSGLGPGTAAGSGSGSGSGSESTGTGSGGGSSTGTSGGGGGPLPAGGLNSGNSADRLWGERFFAPYVDMGLYPVPDLDGLARQHGVGLFCLGFIQATSSGEPAWAGLAALSLGSSHPQAVAIREEIRQLRAAGGDVMVSFGGASGTSLAVSAARAGRGAADLAGRYLQVIDSLSLNRIDLDIEGSALGNRAANQLLAEALRLVQQSRPDLEIWFTLPVLPLGLTGDGLAVVRQALNAGVKLDGVNVMAMDYGDSAAPPAARTMGDYAIEAAQNSQRQLVDLFAGFGVGFGWNQLGITPMIGVNDVRSEVFSSADAQQLEDFARLRGVGMLSMWSIARDNPGPIGALANTHSGTGAASGSYAAIWGDYGSDPLIAGGNVSGGGSSAGTLAGGSSGGSGTGSLEGSNGGGLPLSTLAVAATTTSLIARADNAERFQLGWAWGRRLTIEGFDPAQDGLDLRGFWAEGQQTRVVASAEGAIVRLDFNAQQVLLPGVDAASLSGGALQIWQG